MAAPKGNKFARGKGTKTALQRFAEKCAFEPYEPVPRTPSDIPFYAPPEWLKPFLPAKILEETADGCPF